MYIVQSWCAQKSHDQTVHALFQSRVGCGTDNDYEMYSSFAHKYFDDV